MSENLNQIQKTHYDYVPSEKRRKLIQMVTSNVLSIGKAATQQGIKLSTAKLIVKKFKTTGKIYVSRKERNERKQSDDELEELRQYNTIKSRNEEIENQVCNDQTLWPYNHCYGLPLLYSPAPVFFYYFAMEQ